MELIILYRKKPDSASGLLFPKGYGTQQMNKLRGPASAVAEDEMNKKKLDFFMTILGLALLAVFVVSIVGYGRNLKRAEKKVDSIADIEVPAVPSVATNRLNGVVSAEEWSQYYAEIYASYMKNAENKGHGTGRISYVESDPNIKVLYDGMGFSFDYTEAIDHNYTLEDIVETIRPHKLANCLTCKTPEPISFSRSGRKRA